MNRLKDILVATLVSLEALVLVGSVGVYILAPSCFVWLGARLTQNEPIKYLALVPVALLVVMVRSAGDLLFPSSVDFTILQKWPDYHMVKDRYLISLVITGACTLVVISIWALSLPLSQALNAFAFVTAIAVALVAYGCFAYATWTVKEILSAHVGRKSGG
ncbi:MAG: hypothetical protein AB1578_04535 [Thermodesulfobacteriota bacterium]